MSWHQGRALAALLGLARLTAVLLFELIAQPLHHPDQRRIVALEQAILLGNEAHSACSRCCVETSQGLGTLILPRLCC